MTPGEAIATAGCAHRSPSPPVQQENHQRRGDAVTHALALVASHAAVFVAGFMLGRRLGWGEALALVRRLTGRRRS